MSKSTPAPEPEPLSDTILEAAHFARCNPATLERAIRRGELAVTWRFGKRIIAHSDLVAWIAVRSSSRHFVSGAKAAAMDARKTGARS